MIQETNLFIRLTPGPLKPRSGDVTINEWKGGPETLLQWLETQLGLPVPPFHKASRVSEYATALDQVPNVVFGQSLKTDRWATASELLAKRDELVLSGWNETDSDTLPQIVRDLAETTTDKFFVFPGEPDRLQRIIDALESGQILPPHRCTLYDPPELWPFAWRKVLSKLIIVDSPHVVPLGPSESSLQKAQGFFQSGIAPKIHQDTSFRYVQTRSQSMATEFVGAILAGSPEKLSRTIILCEDDQMALRLDACLNRLGLPTMGSSTSSRAHPALQVLPLTLALCWKPVDPQALLDFLTLPLGPIPGSVASRFTNALTQEPGLGSNAWEKVREELCSQEKDPEGKVSNKLNSWLYGDRTPKGENIPSNLVRSRCNLVAQWASGRASSLAKQESSNPETISALETAAGQASILGELVEIQGTVLSEPQLSRLVEEVIGNGVETTPHLEAAGGPVRVRSLADIDTPFDRFIWLGLSTDDTPRCRWSNHDLKMLRSSGIEIDDGSKALSALRSAEARGFIQVQEAFLAVVVPQDLEKRWHPLWIAIRSLLPDVNLEKAPVVEETIAEGNNSSLKPFDFQCQHTQIQPPQPPRPVWNIPSELISERESISATELQDQLACPLKWTLNYQAKIRPSPIAQLPDDYQLKGSFCHNVLQRVFGVGGDVPSAPEAVKRVLSVFDERLPLDAAPLAQPDKYLDCQRLRVELEKATRTFVEILARGKYRIVGLEVELAGEAFGKTLTGRIDCLAERRKGQEAIIDFKYGGRSKYYSLIEEGKAVQLATYAYARSTQHQVFPAVAYLVLSDDLLYTPSESPVVDGASRFVIDAPSIQSVWEQFSKALQQAGDWLTLSAPIHARPLQDPSQWPDGTKIVLKEKLKNNEVQEVCKYCDYKRICGLQPTL